MTQKFITNSPEETERLGRQISMSLEPGDVVAMYGDLGAGKTALVRGIMHGLGYEGDVTSPTFAIVNEYKGHGKQAAHFDMYRIGNEGQLYSTGFYDYLDGRFIVLIEWSENIDWAIEDNWKRISIEGCADMPRSITLEEVDL
ncbi:MAG: tRNA (adenosine(37)-N6)-threonylcarbamoyltransferase complex ATPase subunit type 1 TsaE [Oscillospiraceae bacterium]